MKAVRNIIFDFGGIIVNLNRNAAIEAFRQLGFNAENDINDYVQSGIFTGLEAGRTSEEEFFAFIREATHRDVTDDAIRKAWNSMLTGIPTHRLQAIASVRDRYRTYMLSNTNSIHWDYSRHDLFPRTGIRPEECFDRIFLSNEIHLVKPAPEAFRHVLKTCGLQAEETLFIDDSAANCEAARAEGMQAFHSCRPDDWLKLIQ